MVCDTRVIELHSWPPQAACLSCSSARVRRPRRNWALRLNRGSDGSCCTQLETKSSKPAIGMMQRVQCQAGLQMLQGFAAPPLQQHRRPTWSPSGLDSETRHPGISSEHGVKSSFHHPQLKCYPATKGSKQRSSTQFVQLWLKTEYFSKTGKVQHNYLACFPGEPDIESGHSLPCWTAVCNWFSTVGVPRKLWSLHTARMSSWSAADLASLTSSLPLSACRRWENILQ